MLCVFPANAEPAVAHEEVPLAQYLQQHLLYRFLINSRRSCLCVDIHNILMIMRMFKVSYKTP